MSAATFTDHLTAHRQAHASAVRTLMRAVPLDPSEAELRARIDRLETLVWHLFEVSAAVLAGNEVLSETLELGDDSDGGVS